MRAAWLLLAAAPALAGGEFFEDFTQKDLDALRASGWVLRDGTGHPGLPGARFSPAQLAVEGGLLKLKLSTDGTPANDVASWRRTSSQNSGRIGECGVKATLAPARRWEVSTESP